MCVCYSINPGIRYPAPLLRYRGTGPSLCVCLFFVTHSIRPPVCLRTTMWMMPCGHRQCAVWASSVWESDDGGGLQQRGDLVVLRALVVLPLLGAFSALLAAMLAFLAAIAPFTASVEWGGAVMSDASL